jgi:tetratricopeptide (TPR) repeat protein
MSTISCDACGQALAMADLQCARCGAPVPPERRRAMMAERAEALAQDGHFSEAARALGGVLEAGPAPDEAKRLWRKRSLWLQKSGEERQLEEAEACLQRSMELDDADELSHQLWIDLLKRRGHLDRAKAVYQKRLEADPADAVAKRQLGVIRSVADFLTVAPPKLAFQDDRKPSTLERWIRPTPKKMLTAGVVLLFSAGGMLWGVFSGPAGPDAVGAAGAAAAGGLNDAAAVALAQSSSGAASWVGNGGGTMMQMLTDPWINGIQALLAAAYLWWGIKERRG